MKKIVLLLMFVTGMVTAQQTQIVGKKLQLDVVPRGSANDSILVRGADKVVKWVPQSSLQADYPVTGYGATNYLPYWYSSSELASTPFYMNGSTMWSEDPSAGFSLLDTMGGYSNYSLSGFSVHNAYSYTRSELTPERLSLFGENSSQTIITSNAIQWLQTGNEYPYGQTLVQTIAPDVNGTITIPSGTGTLALTSDLVPLALSADLVGKYVTEATQTGIVFGGRNRMFYGNIGVNAVDFSFSDAISSTFGATGESSFAVGNYNIASGYGSFVQGDDNQSIGHFSSTHGFSNVNKGYSSFATGSFNTIDVTTTIGGAYSFTSGQGNNTELAGGGALGIALTGKSVGTMIVGQANAIYSDTPNTPNSATQPMFIVGNGDVSTPVGMWTALSRSDALVVRKNGVVEAPSQSIAEINAGTAYTVPTKEWVHSQKTYKVYTALLTQTGNGTSTQTNGTLTIGKRYKITNFVTGDNFTNVADVVVGTINTTGCEFVATGTTPMIYTNGSTLTDTSAPTAIVLENTLGGNVVWKYSSTGIYKATLTNAFTENKTAIFISSHGFGGGYGIVTSANNYASVNDILVSTQSSSSNVDGNLTQTSIEIRVYN